MTTQPHNIEQWIERLAEQQRETHARIHCTADAKGDARLD